ncbi:hypothetical protein AQUCO_03600012v1 [Aquilegia coerulea]|uniref:Uncharacterized protein n=1 Tax=Aquilegia coerulea TaxID=218851 RepID=A0A2G5CUV1_AQUCA|nr:hypothetical protein AQUCO_03600012v1 [Aquilegia coerulea]
MPFCIQYRNVEYPSGELPSLFCRSEPYILSVNFKGDAINLLYICKLTTYLGNFGTVAYSKTNETSCLV